MKIEVSSEVLETYRNLLKEGYKGTLPELIDEAVIAYAKVKGFTFKEEK